MHNLSNFYKPMLVAGVMMAFAAAPFSRAIAQDAMSSPQSSSSSANDESMSAKTGDTWITTKVKSELASTKGVKSTDISVTTTEGVVTLSGTVTSAKQKNHVVHITKNVKGVKSVDSSGLTVAAPSNSGSSQ